MVKLRFIFEVIKMPIERIDPLQPYFVLNTKLYRKYVPINSPVAHFYQFTYTEENPVINGAVPDGATDMIFDTDSGIAMLSGSVESIMETTFEQGHTYFGARLRPGAFEHFGGISASELIGTSVPLSDIFGNKTAENVLSSMDFSHRIESFNEDLSDFLIQQSEIPPLVCGILSHIYERRGDISISELESMLFYSRRHLVRIFGAYIGMDIKSFCRIVRFQSALSALNSGSGKLLTDIAQEYGYYDQTHFQKEFKEFALLTPKVYIKTLNDMGYKDRIKYK